ncbi:hypothetical protein E3N88_26037 [Mikania micrantha]|uniref:DUF8040 domain-containing protein n=1 Tax=Mikania micrantha TaxID=192012 RepID=A0A5N6N985_9ASTR|nr:hypothetical protein E3N88_26037 [Mikania micrantha]
MFNPEIKEYMRRLVYQIDNTCLHQLRMNRKTFVKLYNMLERDRKLKASKYLQVYEQVAIFLYILARHVKNRVVKFHFQPSVETISKYFNNVLNVVIRLQNELFKKPMPISKASTDERWKWFKGCLGAIDVPKDNYYLVDARLHKWIGISYTVPRSKISSQYLAQWTQTGNICRVLQHEALSSKECH